MRSLYISFAPKPIASQMISWNGHVHPDQLQGSQKLCVIRESNPGLYRGRVLFYH